MSEERFATARRRLPPFLLVATAALGAAVALGWTAGKLRPERATPTTADVQATASRGELLFQVHCASCHGPEGRADGPSAATLHPPPRDFAARPWRFDVTRESIRKVTREGIPSTAMPASGAALAEADLALLVEYVYCLALAHPSITHEPSAEEQLLVANEFTDLRGTAPPPLTLSDAAGRVLKLAELKGKLVLLVFWGTSCVHCLKELPVLRELETEFAGRPFAVLYVCADVDDARAAQDRADQVTSGVRAFVDDTGIGLARFEVQTLPAVWLIGPDGLAIGRGQGAKDWRAPTLRNLIQRWLPTVTSARLP